MLTMIIKLVRHKRAHFESTVHGSTQKCPTQYASVDIASIKHPIHPYWNYFPRVVLKDPYMNWNEITTAPTAADPGGQGSNALNKNIRNSRYLIEAEWA